MAASRTKKKTPPRKKPRRWIIPKILMLLGIGGLVAFLVAIFVMEKELNRIGFFTNVKKRPSFQLPTPQQKEDPATPLAIAPSSPPAVEPSQQEPSQPSAAASAQVTEDISPNDKKRLQGSTTSRSTENLSQDDRQRLEDVLRSK